MTSALSPRREKTGCGVAAIFRVPTIPGPQASKRLAQKPARAAVYLSRAIEPKGGREPSARKPAWRRFNPFATLWNDRHLPERTATIDVNLPLQIAALDASIGREARLQRSPRKGPGSGRKPSFNCEPEIGFSTRSGSASGDALNQLAQSGVNYPAFFSSWPPPTPSDFTRAICSKRRSVSSTPNDHELDRCIAAEIPAVASCAPHTVDVEKAACSARKMHAGKGLAGVRRHRQARVLR
jgi:hypothetical protein